jgi:hypothetical protein
MPANLTPEYREAERAYKEAKTPEDRLRCLEHMLAVIPKHKGTDKLQADLKTKIARAQHTDEKKGGTNRRSSMFNVTREGAGQVALVGAPNAGKSSILDRLTNAAPAVADYPYTTIKPQPGMIPYQNIKIQLVDLPPLGREFTETWIPGVVRNADLALLTVNLASDDVLDETEFVLERLLQGKVELVSAVSERYKADGGAQVKTRMVLTHTDHPDASAVKELVDEVFGGRFPEWFFSARSPEDATMLAENIFRTLEIVRVYTKTPGKPAERLDPVILARGSTVMDFAKSIHKDFAEKLNYARIWGKNQYDGQKVTRDHVLEDEDVVELHV